MTSRLASGVLASALIRRVNNEGGHATVVAKGDPDSGSILLLCADRGRVTSLRERLLASDGSYDWQDIGPQEARESGNYLDYLGRRRRSDPDLWIIELDIPNAERFAADTGTGG